MAVTFAIRALGRNHVVFGLDLVFLLKSRLHLGHGLRYELHVVVVVQEYSIDRRGTIIVVEKAVECKDNPEDKCQVFAWRFGDNTLWRASQQGLVSSS